TNTLTAQALKVCGDALVGQGTVSAEVQFPDGPIVPAAGKLSIFNGPPQGNKPVLIGHTFVSSPVSTTVVSKVVIDHHVSGLYGTEAMIHIPSISGGYGSFTGTSVKFDKSWTYKGKKQHLISAMCERGSLIAHGELKLVDGTDIQGTVVKPCTPIG